MNRQSGQPPVVVTRPDCTASATSDEEECDGTAETQYLLRSRANALRLLASVAEANVGACTSELMKVEGVVGMELAPALTWVR
jgi:hypothetical protein